MLAGELIMHVLCCAAAVLGVHEDGRAYVAVVSVGRGDYVLIVGIRQLILQMLLLLITMLLLHSLQLESARILMRLRLPRGFVFF